MTEIALGNGDNAVATARTPSSLSTLAATYPASRLLVLPLDVTRPAQIAAAFAAATARFGRVDVVANNAGVGAFGEVEAACEADARAVFDTNFWGAAGVAREAVRVFREANAAAGGAGGLLLQMSSRAAVQGLPGAAYYAASKFGECAEDVCGTTHLRRAD